MQLFLKVRMDTRLVLSWKDLKFKCNAKVSQTG